MVQFQAVRGRRRRVVARCVATAGASAAAVFTSVTPAAVATMMSNCAESATAVVCPYFYSGTARTFSVPDGVTSLDVTAVGAAGGSASAGRPGGHGASVEDTAVPVTAGETLMVVVGGVGGSGDVSAGGVGGVPGGGGAGGDFPAGNTTAFMDGGGGGGYSGLLVSPSGALVIAGGGGGGGYGGGRGQDGGTGDAGRPGASADSSGYRAPGTGGNGAGAGSSGLSLAGGQGGDSHGSGNSSGGGGGGGYFGGGGGGGGIAAGGGRGGSSYGVTGLTNETVSSTPASVTIRYELPGGGGPMTASLSRPGEAVSHPTGSPVAASPSVTTDLASTAPPGALFDTLFAPSGWS